MAIVLSGALPFLGLKNNVGRMKVTINEVLKARETVRPVIRSTELLKSEMLSDQLGADIFLKLENTQHTGSFKLRGAFNKISSLSATEKARGVVASSAGNHAQGVAFSARKAGVKCTIVMPLNAPLVKVEATRGYGAEVILHGEIYDDAFDKAKELEREKGYVFVHPYEDEAVIAGQGTLGLEIFEAQPDLDLVVVPVGGGGLISGVATAIKAKNPKCKIIGVQSDQVDTIARQLRGEVPSNRARISTIADGIAVKKPSEVMFNSFIKPLVDEIVTVSDDEIAEAIVFLLERHKTVAEGAGAAAMAALLAKKFKPAAKTGIVICGGNIDLNLIEKILERGLIRKGRLVELSVIVDDLPGNLNRLTKILADNRANILEVHHDRVALGLDLRQTKINFIVETTSLAHVDLIKAAFKEAGARLHPGREVNL